MSISNIYIDQGSDFSTTVTINDSNGDLLDLFGYTANAQIRKTYSSTLYVDFPTTFSEDRSTGEITLDLSSTATSQLNPGLYVYDLMDLYWYIILPHPLGLHKMKLSII
jgi:hypothetical protein